MQPLVMQLWWCWSLLAASQGAVGCLLSWKHPLQLQPRGATLPQMVLVLWFSMWVIWLITTSFQSQTPPGKLGSLLIWGAILGWVAEAAGLRLVVSGTETMETLEILSYQGFHWNRLWDKEPVQKFTGDWSWETYTFNEVSNVKTGGMWQRGRGVRNWLPVPLKQRPPLNLWWALRWWWRCRWFQMEASWQSLGFSPSSE